jgi:hypothetical protein
MASINTGRVVTGGLVAGVVANACDMVTNFTLLKDDMTEVARRVGADPAVLASFSGAVPWMLVDFVLGMLMVWTYAAMRPRFGAGPKTAILAGLVPYLSATAVVYGFTSFGLMSVGAFLRGSAAALVSMMLATLAGAWVYKEEDDRVPARTA